MTKDTGDETTFLLNALPVTLTLKCSYNTIRVSIAVYIGSLFLGQVAQPCNNHKLHALLLV